MSPNHPRRGRVAPQSAEFLKRASHPAQISPKALPEPMNLKEQEKEHEFEGALRTRLTLPGVELDEELGEGSHQEGQPHPRASQGVGQGQACPAALGRHHRGRLVQAGEAHPWGRGKMRIPCPKRGSCVSIPCPSIPSWQSLVPRLKGGDFCCHSQGRARFGGWGIGGWGIGGSAVL